MRPTGTGSGAAGDDGAQGVDPEVDPGDQDPYAPSEIYEESNW